MAQGKVRLHGRFSPGTVVRLVKVADAGVLRAEGGEEVDSGRVGKDGSVEFSAEVGARYFVAGYQNGFPLEVRVTGRESNDPAITLAQAPIGPDRVRLSDGSWVDEPPELDRPRFEAAPDLAQQMVPKGTVQRSDTPRGTAHPVDTEEGVPLPSMEEKKKGQVLMSDTEHGTLHPAVVGPQRQEDVAAGTWQRSDTPTGVATPLPRGGAVRAQEEKESSMARASRGEPGRVAAEPMGTARASGLSGAKHVSNQPLELTQPAFAESRREGGAYAPRKADAQVREDAQGQKVEPDLKEKTAETSGQVAQREATPKPTRRRTAKPVEGGKAKDQS